MNINKNTILKILFFVDVIAAITSLILLFSMFYNILHSSNVSTTEHLGTWFMMFFVYLVARIRWY